MAPDEWTTEVAKLYRMRSAGKTDRRSLAGSILFISGQDGRQRHPSPLPPVDKISVFPVATHIDGYCRNDNDTFNNILHIGIDADKGKTAFDQARIIAPIRVPVMRPTPPIKLLPPITAAAIASSS